MQVAVVTTTINKPTIALKKYARIAKERGWLLVIVGDKKTPHEEFAKMRSDWVVYIDPEMQERYYPDLGELIGWNCIPRRNIGFVYAYGWGADVIATVDDDNVPMPEWGKDILVGQEVEVNYYTTRLPVFDPLSVMVTDDELWHRGYPIQLVAKKNKITYADKVRRRVLVQADMWDGDPDIDAIARIAFYPDVYMTPLVEGCYCGNKISPFNSQNTFLSREVFPTYFCFPHIGRMDDIWGSYITQHYFPGSVVYGEATVYQKRNPHNLFKDLRDEMLGYEKSLELIKDLKNWKDYLPERSLRAYEVYKEYFN